MSKADFLEKKNTGAVFFSCDFFGIISILDHDFFHFQVLNCYFEAYQHAAGSEQRFALAQVITDIMQRKPHLDLGSEYFVQAYRDEILCLETHRQLIKTILDCQVAIRKKYRFLSDSPCPWKQIQFLSLT